MRIPSWLGATFVAAALLIGCSSSEESPSNPVGTGGTTNTEAGVDASSEAAPEAGLDAPAETAAEAATEETGADAAADVASDALPSGTFVATIDTNKGKIVLELNATASPITVDNFRKYADAKFFDGLIFHRVIKGFMIQGGGLTPDMNEKATPFPPIVNEAKISKLSNLAGTIAMARTSDPDSATSQFFINTVDNKPLDPNPKDPAGYAVFGTVTSGMDVVKGIEDVATHTVGWNDDVPVDTVLINSIVVVAK